MYLFLIPLSIGILFTWASAFTAAYSRRWGERGGRIISMIFRNVLGIPLWMFGLAIAWLTPAPLLVRPFIGIQIFGLLLIIIGSVLVVWGHLVLGWPSHMPSVHDQLVHHSLYACIRHPIYAGGLLVFPGLGLLRPTLSFILACTIGVVYLLIQARLEEIDLLQRMPTYSDYMKEVPRFLPKLRRRR